MFGIVVSPTLKRYDAPCMLVIFVDKDGPLLYTKNIASCTPSLMSKEERKQTEKLIRRKGLEFGDWISFDRKDVKNRVINEYEKIRSAMEYRVDGDFLQFQTECVFCKNKDQQFQCYSDFFGNVAVSAEVANRFMMDVSCLCWVSVGLSKTSRDVLSVSFGEFIDVAENQEVARLAPWNANDPRFIISFSDFKEDDDRGSCVPVANIVDDKGIVSGIRSIFSKNSFERLVLITYLDPDKSIIPGCFVEFKAVYNQFLDVYTVRNYTPALQTEPIRCDSVNFGHVPVLTVEVCHQPNKILYGYLYENKYGLGVICDPDNLTAPLLLDNAENKSFEVCVEDTGVGHFCRFVIRTLPKPTAYLVEDAFEKELQPFSGKGFYVSNGLIFVPERSTFEFRFSDSDRLNDDVKQLKVGTWLKITAQIIRSCNRIAFIVKKWKELYKSGLPDFKLTFCQIGYVFEAKCRYVKSLSVFISNEFGYVDDPDGKVPPKVKEDSTVKVFWVRYKAPGSRSLFSIYSTNPPKEVSPDEFRKCTVTPPTASQSDLANETKNVEEQNIANLEENSNLEKNEVEQEAGRTLCKSTGCSGRLLLRRVLNDRKLLRKLRYVGLQNMVLQMITAISGSLS